MNIKDQNSSANKADDTAHRKWHRVTDMRDIKEGEVTTRSGETKTIALSYIDGKFRALENTCPH